MLWVEDGTQMNVNGMMQECSEKVVVESVPVSDSTWAMWLSGRKNITGIEKNKTTFVVSERTSILDKLNHLINNVTLDFFKNSVAKLISENKNKPPDFLHEMFLKTSVA